MIQIVHDELIELMGPVDSHLMIVEPGPTVVMMSGLQGSGKTTTCGKLAAYLKKQGKTVTLAAVDLQRPAAVQQLETLMTQVRDDMDGPGQTHFYAEPNKVAEYGKAVGVAVTVARNALAAAKKNKSDVLILDTAGRLHIDDALMGELRGVNQAVQPHQIYLVVDAMTGQDAVNSAKGVQRAAGTRRGDPHEVRFRHARRGGALGQAGDRHGDQVYRYRREARRIGGVSPGTVLRRASWAWATC